MYGTQCNDIISNIVFIRIFFTLFSNRIINFFLPCSGNCSQVAMFQIMPALCPHGQDEEKEGGGGVQPNEDKPGQGKGGPKNVQIYTNILYG